MLARGEQVALTVNGQTAQYEVKAIRYAPIAYLEVEPVVGGKRVAIAASKLHG